MVALHHLVLNTFSVLKLLIQNAFKVYTLLTQIIWMLFFLYHYAQRNQGIGLFSLNNCLT